MTEHEDPPDSVEPAANDQAAEVPLDPLAEMTAERDRVKDQLLRVAADFDNFRKRSRKELEQGQARAKEDTLRELLPIFDNLGRAVEATSAAVDIEAVRSGVEMVLKQFEDISSRLGVTRLVSVGERFDPNLHDAFQQMETSEYPPGTIVREYQPAYRLGEKLLRPAMVVVARKPPEPAAES